MITKNTQLKKVIELAKDCNKCGHCCNHGSGSLTSDDITNISKHLEIPEEELKEKYMEETERFNTKLFRPKLATKGKPYGKCIFLNENKECKIHEVKPLGCKIGNCKEYGEELSLWFMLNYHIKKNDPESIRQFATYLNSGGKTLQGGQLSDFVKDKKMLNKILSYEVLK